MLHDMTAMMNLVVLVLLLSTLVDGKDSCTRGGTGTWVPDMEYAAKAQYSQPLNHIIGRTDMRFRAMRESGEIKDKYRKPTTMRWNELSDGCPVSIIEFIDFCHVAEKLQVKRFFFLGDELTQEQAISLFMLLGPRDPVIIDSDTHIDLTVQCYTGHKFQIVFVRNDELLQTPVRVSLEEGKGNCCTKNDCYCYPWFDEYAAFEGRSVVVANTGSHLGDDTSAYEAALQRFATQMESFGREEDLIFFRTSSPGHGYCQRPDIVPIFDIFHYMYDASRYESKAHTFPAYNLDVQARFNSIVVTVAREHDLHVLDIFPMTVLRQDGHMAEDPSYRGKGINPNDCIHYSLPGVIDWWNHLLYSCLKDLMELENASTGQ